MALENSLVTERKIKEQETRITRKKRNEIWSKARQSGRARLERLLSQSWPRFSLVFPCHHPGYISVIFRESHSIISLSSVFYRLATDAPLPPPCLAAGLISKWPGKSGTIRYISRIIISPYESWLEARKTETRS